MPVGSSLDNPNPVIGDVEDDHQDPELELTLVHHNQPHTFFFPPDATITDLSDTVAETLHVPPANQKFIVSPQPGLLKPPFKDAALPLATIVVPSTKKIQLLGSTTQEISDLEAAVQASQSRASRRAGRLGGRGGPVKAATPARRVDWRRAQEEATYTFTTLRPLPYLPHPERSLRFLERLRDDPGVRAAMRKHRWTVPLLTEMDPASHTTHESRTLGLNRNGGEVIELRLRTDAYDGYRDYRTIRATLCHELAHNVWGEHDRNFWDLCKQIEREVAAADWRHGGHALSQDEFYNPHDTGLEDVHADHGGWTGGEYVLGAMPAEASSSGTGAGVPSLGAGALSRRDILAKAAEERLKRQKNLGQGDPAGPST